MNKTDLSKRLAKKTYLNQEESLYITNKLFEAMLEILEEGDDLTINGFGKFYLYTHPARPVRNLITNEEMILQQYKALKFKPSDLVKKLLKSKDNNE